MTDGERDPAATTWALGKRVRDARGRLSLKHVSTKAGIGVETIRQIETGQRSDDKPWAPPRPATLLKLARALEIPDAEALKLAGYEPKDYIDEAEDDGVPLMAPAVLAAEVARLDPEVRRAIETLVVVSLKAQGYLPADTPAPDVEVRTVTEAAKSGVWSRGEAARGSEESESARD